MNGQGPMDAVNPVQYGASYSISDGCSGVSKPARSLVDLGPALATILSLVKLKDRCAYYLVIIFQTSLINNLHIYSETLAAFQNLFRQIVSQLSSSENRMLTQTLCFPCRLNVACTSRDLRDFVYDHFELYPNINAVGSVISTSSSSKDVLDHATTRNVARSSSFEKTLAWAEARGKIRRLRAAINPHKYEQSSCRKLPTKWIENSFRHLASTMPHLSSLISLHITLDIGDYACPEPGASFVRDLITVAPKTLKQLTLCIPNIHFPEDGAKLTALTALSLHSPDATGVGSGVQIHPNSLPSGLLHFSIGSLGSSSLPEALLGVKALESLAVDWASDPAEAAVVPDFSLLEGSLTSSFSPSEDNYEEDAMKDQNRRWNTAHLTHLSLGYFQASALPRRLPPTLRSLDLQWNLTAVEPACRKAGFSVEEFHNSFSSLAPLTALTHLNLNKALGVWGLPPAILKLTQLESLGVSGADPSACWVSALRAELPQQLQVFRNLRKLDIEIFDAAAGWDHLASLKKLEVLRLGRGGQPEAYVRGDVQSVIGHGLVRLLPALPALKEVHTEGMLLPATSACSRWARLAGLEAPEFREEAANAVEKLSERRVMLQRWFCWPFSPCEQGMAAWDEVQ
jgi:hypothetical protein